MGRTLEATSQKQRLHRPEYLGTSRNSKRGSQCRVCKESWRASTSTTRKREGRRSPWHSGAGITIQPIFPKKRSPVAVTTLAASCPTQARAIVPVLGKAVVRASDPSLVIPPGSTDLLHAPNHGSRHSPCHTESQMQRRWRV